MKVRPVRPVLCAIFVACAVAVSAQNTAPVWAKADAFWYRTTVNGSHVWVSVDAEHGVRQPLFDHQRLAIELTQKTGHEFTAATLPFANPGTRFVVKYDGSSVPVPHGLLAIEFVLDNAAWRCELQAEWDWARTPPSDYECTKDDGPVPAARAESGSTVVASPDGRWEAFVRNDNVMVRAAGATGATPLSKDGTPTRTYHEGSIRWSADSKTVSAYRVDAAIWRSNEVSGTVKTLIAKTTWPVPASPLEGRWVIEANPWFDETYRGTGRAGGAASEAGRGGRASQPAPPGIILVLRLTPGGGVAGTVSGLVRGLGAPGNQPQPDIEISRGELRGGSLTFEIWRYDGHHNRLRVEARPDATGLALTFSRATPNGPPVTYTTRATRASF